MENMKPLRISPAVRSKLDKKHFVEEKEVLQCFMNREGPLLVDTREEHATNPPTLWFLARTNRGRLLKVAYIQSGPQIDLKTCYEPNEEEIRIYQSKSAST